MKLVPLDSLFDIRYGNKFDLNKLDINEDSDINFVSRSSQNLGIVCKVSQFKGIKPFPRGLITVTLGGTYLLSSFVQQDNFYTAQNIKVLTPKKKMTFGEKIYYCKIIELNRFRYTSHGREANKTLGELPVPDETPSWVNEIKLPKIPNKEPIISKNINLHENKWSWFYITDLFSIRKGERLVKTKRTKGKIPLITSSSENNGVVTFISYDKFKENKKCFENKITIDMFFNVFYHNYKYFSDDNVHTLIPKFEENNPHIFLFLVTILKKLQYKYDYGRQLRLSRIEFDKIKLPITKKGEPNWQFMENYVKSLPYSKAIA